MNRYSMPALAAAGLSIAACATAGQPGPVLPDAGALKSFNPAVSVIIDGMFYHENSKEGLPHIKEEMAGFGHAHPGGDGHDHAHGMENGFNLRHLEIQFSAEIDSYFKASAIAAIDLHGAELEVAEVETTGLPWGFQAKAGKFYSDFGYLNAQHAHQWDFSDQPLVYELVLGDHGLNEKGVQLSWLAPTPFYLLFGGEALQGGNEKMFSAVEADELPDRDGPRLGVGWVKFAPLLAGRHALQLGLFAAAGRHQEAHDGGTVTNGVPVPGGGPDGDDDHWLDGTSSFWGGDAVYKYGAGRAYGQGDLVVQAEYLMRKKDLEVKQHDLVPAVVGNRRVDRQDGFYAQATYGILPRWRTGLRYERVGLTNDTRKPNGDAESFGDSWRASAMVDFRPSEFSQIRFQAGNGDYETEEGRENVWEAFVQLTVSLGAHGAHKF